MWLAESRLAASDPAIGQLRQLRLGETDFMKAKIITARFYADHLLTKAPGMRDSIVEGADCVTALALESF